MNHCDTLLHAGLLITQDEQRRILENTSLAIRDGLIVAIGESAAMRARWQAAATLDCSRMLVLPGLVNAHTHVAMTILRGLADDMPLIDWLTRRIFPVEAGLTPEEVRLGSLLGFAEMLRTGTTACLDMYIHEAQVLEAAHTAGIRCLAGEGVFQFPSACCPDYRAALELTRRLADRWQGHERVRLAVMPHSVYTTTPDMLRACRDLADALNLPLHIHLAESPDETARCLALHGRRPVAHAAACGLFDLPCTAAHVVDVNDEEMALLARAHVAAVHNPSSNMKLASGVMPLRRLRDAGLCVALGSDGAASNNQLNMFAEMRQAALLHKAVSGDPTALRAQEALDMATRHGASALHDPRLGRLAVGHPADLAALDLDAPNLQPLYQPVSHVVYAATGHEVRLTMIQGEIVYRDGRFPRFDYPALLEAFRAVRAAVLQRSSAQDA
ncbi:MAG TPA: amidohydrolase [Candidatus Desulfovibrio intestinavium]|uniref:5-methylthioadenosine/S-adenosylhomocysteine deaminase n=1 Tax=Candidatus Desulfovibrio intestinavium TaxID=2838534 RepID=A0A9D2KSI4_9BACT|nr:amidohydrolase [Candidatus Desulfovibrio intestinavium]